MPLTGKKIVFIGAGSMAEAIIRGLVSKNIAAPDNIFVVNRSDREKLSALQQRYGIRCAFKPEEKELFIREADLVTIAMKPKDVRQAFDQFNRLLHRGQLLVSVVVGLSLDTISVLVPSGMPVVRTMPNTSSAIGLGTTGLCCSENVTLEMEEMALSMFQSIGQAVLIPEDMMNMVTGISGSGPAYVYYFMEAMIASGIQGGLSPELARDLTVQTLLGAASMVQATGENPADLRKKVTSPNGSTQAAIETFNQHHLKEAIDAGIRRCVERAAEIGDQITTDVRSTQ